MRRIAAASAALAFLPTGASAAPDLPFANLDQVVWLSVTAGSVFVALASLSMFMRNRRDDRLAAAENELVELRMALDRTEALLAADDQKTIVWENGAAVPKVFGGLPERLGAPVDAGTFLALDNWIVPEGVQLFDQSVDRLRRRGEPFQIAVRSKTGGLIEVTGRPSGKRTLLRFRELTGERRSFAELKEQAIFVINEMTAFRALADATPFPMWRRNRVGRLTWVNAAYANAVEAGSAESVLTAGVELLASRTREAAREAHRAGSAFRDSASAVIAGTRRRLEIVDVPTEDGSIGCAIDASDTDRLRDEARRTAEANRRTMDALAAGIAVFGTDGRLLFHNTAYRKLWDLPEAFLAGRPDDSAVLDHLRADRKLPEQADYRDWRAKHIAASRSGQARDELWHLPDGRTLRMVTIPQPQGGVTYIYENVTEQLALESRLESLSQLQGETLDHLREAVAVFGTDGKLRLFNPVFANIWRLSPTWLKSEPHISEIIANCAAIHPDRESWEEVRRAVTAFDHDAPAEGRMQRPDGSVIDFATVALPEGMTMMTFVDVTDSARIQRVLSERNEALEAADRLKSDFIQHVSYELRSPLTSIIGFAEMLSDETVGDLNPRQREYMDHIASSSAALLAIINDILDLATVDAGIMTLEIGEVGIAAVTEAAVEGLRDRLREQRIELEIDIPADVGTFQVDESRMRQILFNIVSNAIRFSNADGHVRVEGRKRGGWVTYVVSDDGVGIPAEVLPAVFQPFEAHASQGRRRGAGLGLSIVKSLVELHGGSIDIRSEMGEGTTVTVRLPESPQDAAEAAE